MAYQYVQSGNPLQLEHLLPDGNAGLFPLAVVLDATGTPVLGSPFPLASQGFGLYVHRTFTPVNGAYVSIYIVYTDAGHTTESLTYGRSTDHFQVDSALTQSAQNTANITAIKAKTDLLTFTGANVNANAQVVSDKTNYQLTAAQVAAIQGGVWDINLSAHVSPGTTGEALQDSAASSPSAVAGAVWDELVSAHSIPGSFSLITQAIQQYGSTANDALMSGTYGLAVIKAEVINQAAAVIAQVNVNETKIDAIIPALGITQAALKGEIDQNQILIEAVSTQLTSSEAAIIAEINVNEVKLDALAAQVGTIQNNTTMRFVVPDRLIKPASGNKTYQFHLRLYDETGHAQAPDSTPTIRIRRLDTNVDIVVNAPMTQDGVKVGAYYYDFTISAGTNEYQALVEATVIELGETRYIPAVTEVTEFESDLNALQAQLTSVQGTVVNTNTAVNSGVYGLAALKTGQGTIVTEVNQNELAILAVKAKTDLIPASIATSAEVAAVNATVLTRPAIADIVTQLNLVRDYIVGPDNRNITQVYNKIDFTPIMKTNDARLNYLDAPVSSLSTLDAATVWAYGSRSLTDFTLPSLSVKAIWDYLGSQATTPSSLGKLLVDNLDDKITSRATYAQVAAGLAGVAQESTVSSLAGMITSGDNQTQIDVAAMQLDVTAIKAKTQNLPSDPVSASVVTGGFSAQTLALAAIDLKATGIKTKTDNLPPDPAKETSVLSRPTNPVLSSDIRLNRLDVPVSSRGTLDVADIANLATISALGSMQTALTNEINQNEIKTDLVQATVNLVKAKTDLIPSQPVSKGQLDAAVIEIINEVDSACTGGGGGGATAAEIWSFPSRTITQDPQSFGPDISDLATKQDVEDISINVAECQMSTTLNSTDGTQELVVWLERNGVVVTTSEDAAVFVKDRLGTTLWSANLASPSADGVFVFSTPFVPPTADQNYYVDIEIADDVGLVSTRKAFITVG